MGLTPREVTAIPRPPASSDLAGAIALLQLPGVFGDETAPSPLFEEPFPIELGGAPQGAGAPFGGTDRLTIDLVQCMATKDVAQVVLLVEHQITYGKDDKRKSEVRTWTVEGVAKRDPKDRADSTTGLMLATGRALETAARRILREANGRVKHNDDMKADRVKRAKLKEARKAKNKVATPRKVAAKKTARKRVTVAKTAKKSGRNSRVK